ncbi:MAG: hypothetical protein K0R89_1728 [Ramlibacter sp.]|jgi:hypothetical protein|nr:hypothetical protein [Ramlibacter sp.]
MKHAVDPDVVGGMSIFEKSCAFCGARFRVLAVRAAPGAHPEEYDCPECGMTYRTEAAGEPEVQLLSRRTDGRSDRYQQTMF